MIHASINPISTPELFSESAQLDKVLKYTFTITTWRSLFSIFQQCWKYKNKQLNGSWYGLFFDMVAQHTLLLSRISRAKKKIQVGSNGGSKFVFAVFVTTVSKLSKQSSLIDKAQWVSTAPTRLFFWKGLFWSIQESSVNGAERLVGYLESSVNGAGRPGISCKIQCTWSRDSA